MRRCQTFLARGFLVAASLSLLAGCAPPTRAATPAPAPREPVAVAVATVTAPAEPEMVEVVERALPAVVLLLNTRADGTTSYGAGLILGKDGRVLTNHHVIEGAKTLGAILYKPGRVSYTPMDGGLSRYIFENQKDIVATTLVEGDATSDLAIVKVDADTSRLPVLAFSKEKVRPGERVFALGHPQETVWSFTAGAVSALHNGAIQHDAVLSSGSSGGPLLNAHGEVVGVNTARVTSESRGLSFARPIEMASRFMINGAKDELDLTSPEKAVVSCWHAHELSSPSVTECVDWDAQWLVFRSALEAVRSPHLAPKTAELVARYGGANEDKAGWIQSRKADITSHLRSSFGGSSAEPMARAVTAARALSGTGLQVAPTSGTTATEASPVASAPPSKVETGAAAGGAEAELATIAADRQKKKLEQNGIKVDLKNPKTLHDLLRMGVRIDETRVIDAERVWVLLAGRNPDGSPYRYSELWVKVGPRWVQRTSPRAEDLATLPGGWAPPVDDFQYARQRLIATLVSGGAGG